MLRAIHLLIRHPKLTAACLVVSLAIAAIGAARIGFRFRYSDFYDYPGNPDVPALERYVNEFGDGGSILLLVSAKDVFSSDTLHYVDRLTRRFQQRAEFMRVRSLTNVAVVRASPDGIETGPLTEHMPETRAELDAMRKVVFSSSLLLRRLVSSDATLTAVVLELSNSGGLADLKRQQAALEDIDAVLREVPKPGGVTVAVSGGPKVEVETTNTIIRDQLVLTPAVLTLIALALLATFRSAQGVIVPLTAVTVSVIWTLGIFGSTIRTADLLGSIVPVVLLSYGVVDPVFVLARYYKHAATGLSREQALLKALEQLLLPCFLTSLSTALGFAAFATATLPTVRNFGVIVGAGILLAFVTTVVVLPVLIMLLPTPERALVRGDAPPFVDGLMRWLFRVTRPRRGFVLACAVALIVLGAVAYQRTGINNVYVGVLPDGPTVRSVELANQKLSGVMVHALLLEGPPDVMKRPDVLKAIAAVDAFAETNAIVGSSSSLTDVLRDIHRAFNDGEPDLTPLPESATLTAQYLSLLDPKDRAEFVNDDLSRTHITIRAQDRGSRIGLRFVDELKRFVAAQHFERFAIHATVTGSGLAYRELDRLVREIVLGFVIAFAIIVALQWLLFRSLRIAVASILPNLIPVATAFLTIRALGLQLRFDNAVVLCVCVGGLFNTTIHLVARMLQQIREGQTDPDTLIEQALRTVGPPSLYTAVVLSLGFSVLLLSDFPGMRTFGILCSVTLSSGFIADAVVTSVIMRWLVGVGTSLVAADSSRISRDESRLQSSGGQL